MNGLRTAGLASALLALSACGGNGIGSAPTTVPIAAQGRSLGQAAPGRPATLNGTAGTVLSEAAGAPGPSWMVPDAKSGTLLYVSDWNANLVDVYSYPSLKLAGQLTTDMLNPDGLCTDAKGDVFVVNNTPNADDVLEFKHGGTTPIATLGNPAQVGVSCSVDPVSGDLAVTNIEQLSGGAGSVSIYPKATGSPTMYADPDISSVYFCGYDDKGNLYIDGFSGGPSEGSFQFAELPKGKSTFKAIVLKGATINYPGDVVWDGKYVDVGDQEYAHNGSDLTSAIYRTTGSGAKVDSKEVLSDSDDVSGFLLDGASLIGTNNYSTTTGFWTYPKSGKETKTVGGFSEPIGVALSK